MTYPFDKLIEAYAIYLYDEDGFALAIHTAEDSWSRDREDVRERYRVKARRQLKSVGLPS